MSPQKKQNAESERVSLVPSLAPFPLVALTNTARGASRDSSRDPNRGLARSEV